MGKEEVYVDNAEPPAVVAPATAQNPDADHGAATVALDTRPAPSVVDRPVSMGATTFFLAGIGGAGVVGGSAFVRDGLGQDMFVRVSASAGQSAAEVMRITWAAGGLDTCLAIPGNYPAGTGLELDLCGGAEAGLTALASSNTTVASVPGQTLAYVNLGPRVELRAELGPRLSFLLRGSLGLNVARDTFMDATGTRVEPSIGTARLDLGFSWKL
jgi:hypothetical protein